MQLRHGGRTTAAEIRHPSTFYQYQDTLELQETLLHTIMDTIMGIDLLQGTKTMICGVAIVLSIGMVVSGGIGAVGILT